MKTPKIGEILRKFKEIGILKGWKTSENEDWFEANSVYHNFLLAREVHPSSFKRIALSGKCVIREGLSYRVVKACYTAWLFTKPTSQTLVKTVLENPDFVAKTAIYDLSPLLDGENVCITLNQTDSGVFKEFENFLRNQLSVRLEPFVPEVNLEAAHEDCSIAELA